MTTNIRLAHIAANQRSSQRILLSVPLRVPATERTDGPLWNSQDSCRECAWKRCWRCRSPVRAGQMLTWRNVTTVKIPPLQMVDLGAERTELPSLAWSLHNHPTFFGVVLLSPPPADWSTRRPGSETFCIRPSAAPQSAKDPVLRIIRRRD